MRAEVIQRHLTKKRKIHPYNHIHIYIYMSFQLWLTLSISWPATHPSQPSQPSEASRTSTDEASLRRESHEWKPWSQVGSNKYEHVKIYEIYSLFMLVWLATVGVRSYMVLYMVYLQVPAMFFCFSTVEYSLVLGKRFAQGIIEAMWRCKLPRVRCLSCWLQLWKPMHKTNHFPNIPNSSHELEKLQQMPGHKHLYLWQSRPLIMQLHSECSWTGRKALELSIIFKHVQNICHPW